MSATNDTESGLFDLLLRRYRAPEWAVFGSVRNRAGFDADRTADALAISLWPSRGLRLHGFEIKCSRSDWLTELKDPSKAEAFSVYCDHWWVVTSPGIVQGGELPPTWGLLERQGSRLVCITEAPKLEPQPLPRTMLAAMCKRLVETENRDLRAAESKGYERGLKAGEASAARRVEQAKELTKQVSEFQAASGVDIRHAWEIGKIGEAVRLIRRGSEAAETLERERRVLGKALEAVDLALRELRATGEVGAA